MKNILAGTAIAFLLAAIGCASAPPAPEEAVKKMESAINTDNASELAALCSSAMIKGFCIPVRAMLETFDDKDNLALTKADLALSDIDLMAKIIQFNMGMIRTALNRETKFEITAVKMEDNGTATVSIRRKDAYKIDPRQDRECAIDVQLILENNEWKFNSSFENPEDEAVEDEEENDDAAPPAPANDYVEKDPKIIETADQYLRNADLFRDQHPYDIGDQIKQYQNLIEKYPGTPAAKEAAARIEQCKKEPGNDGNNPNGDDWEDEGSDGRNWDDPVEEEAVPVPMPAPAPMPPAPGE